MQAIITYTGYIKPEAQRILDYTTRLQGSLFNLVPYSRKMLHLANFFRLYLGNTVLITPCVALLMIFNSLCDGFLYRRHCSKLNVF